MEKEPRNKLLRIIMELLTIIVAALLGWLAGCSAEWTPQRSSFKLLWPDRAVELKLHIDGPTTQPQEPTQ